MHTSSLLVPREALELSQTLKEAGYEAYLIGGCVRDLLLNREPKDWDITTNATPEQIQALFKETFYENTYGTVGVVTESLDPKLKVIEVTPYREESGYSNARHPDEIRFSDTLSADLKRRDFTVNAIAYDAIGDKLIDEHGGQEDLRRRVIKAVGDPNERFREDALRTLRAIRIAGELQFAIDTDTAKGITANAAQLGKISKERIRDELKRILESDTPLQALYMAQKMGILGYIIPELETAVGVADRKAHV